MATTASRLVTLVAELPLEQAGLAALAGAGVLVRCYLCGEEFLDRA